MSDDAGLRIGRAFLQSRDCSTRRIAGWIIRSMRMPRHELV
jgi:hypothetical protein